MIDPVSPSERARTILASCATAAVTGVDPSATAPPVVATGRLVLLQDTAPRTGTALPVEVEVADAAPLAMRQRIRGRVHIVGRAVAAADCHALHVHPITVALVEEGTRTPIDVPDLLAAEPDPLHSVEASMLCHLERRHGDVLVTLTRLVGARLLQGVVRVWPYRLDRYGLVLRLEHAGGHADQRLGFGTPISSPDQLPTAMTALVARARTNVPACARPRPTAPLSSILRAGDAARRVCSTEHDDPLD